MNDHDAGGRVEGTLETTRNTILAALAPDERDRLRPHLTYHNVVLGESLFEAGDDIDSVFFPDNSIASIVGTTPQGGTAEIGIIGREGVVGLDAFLGAKTIGNPVMIQLADGLFKLSAAEALKEFKRAGAFHAAVLGFTHKLLVQVSQTAVCNALHKLDERLARWLLMCRDRSRGDHLKLTQEFLALMVGVTRASVTLSAITLQEKGYITYSRGMITMIDRQGLMDFACDCYRIVRVKNEAAEKV